MAALTETRKSNIGILEMDVLQHLLDWGQLTAKEIAEDLKTAHELVSASLLRLLNYRKVARRWIHNEGEVWFATEEGRRFFPDHKPSLDRTKRPAKRNGHPEDKPTVNTVCLPDPKDYMVTIARWIKRTDLPKESGHCHLIAADGKRVRYGAEQPTEQKTKRIGRDGPPPQDPLNDPRLPEALRLRHELHYNVKQIATALHMSNGYLKRMFDMAGVERRRQRGWKRLAETAAD